MIFETANLIEESYSKMMEVNLNHRQVEMTRQSGKI